MNEVARHECAHRRTIVYARGGAYVDFWSRVGEDFVVTCAPKLEMVKCGGCWTYYACLRFVATSTYAGMITADWDDLLADPMIYLMEVLL